MTKNLELGVADIRKADISPTLDASLKSYYQFKFLPQLAKVTGRQPILDAYFPREKAARYIQYWYAANNDEFDF